nr:DUF429 domain-containing protein [uncultured Caldimonas sp.]
MDVANASDIAVVGVDFTSRPTRTKPITVARGQRSGDVVQLKELLALPTDAAFADWLAAPGPWVGAFDFPFGLPRELVEHLGWPVEWLPMIRHYTSLSRETIRDTFAAFCAARPVGGKFAHRACDAPAGSSPSMKWVNPPVAFMLHAGVPRLLEAGVHLPGLHDGDTSRVALEGYPGLLARELIGSRSYKADEKAKQTPERLVARKDMLEALEQGRTRLGLRLRITHAQRDRLAADPMADSLDAVLCMMQAAWGLGHPNWGKPLDADPLEGWILTA